MVAAELIPLTVPEVRRLLWWLVWRAGPPLDCVLAWSRWRRGHQAQTRRRHYQRRRTQLRLHVQL